MPPTKIFCGLVRTIAAGQTLTEKVAAWAIVLPNAEIGMIYAVIIFGKSVAEELISEGVANALTHPFDKGVHGSVALLGSARRG